MSRKAYLLAPSIHDGNNGLIIIRLLSLTDFLSQVNVAINQLLEVGQKYSDNLLTPDTLAVGMARLGQPTQQVHTCPRFQTGDDM